MVSLIEEYERHDAGRLLKVEKARIKAHIAQIRISLGAIRAVEERYIEAKDEVSEIVNALKVLISGIE